MSIYVDTSALGALLLAQPHTDALAAWLDATDEDLVSTYLLETEMRRIAVREEIDQAAVTRLLAGVSLAELDRAAFLEAGLLQDPHLRPLDALHLQGAIRLDVSGLLTYDRRLKYAAAALGFDVVSPC